MRSREKRFNQCSHVWSPVTLTEEDLASGTVVPMLTCLKWALVRRCLSSSAEKQPKEVTMAVITVGGQSYPYKTIPPATGYSLVSMDGYPIWICLL